MLAERMNTFSGSPTSALIAKVAELRAEGKDIISLNGMTTRHPASTTRSTL